MRHEFLGAGLIFTPLLFKRWIGENASLILALFFAIEPGFIALSRTSTGTMIALVGLKFENIDFDPRFLYITDCLENKNMIFSLQLN